MTDRDVYAAAIRNGCSVALAEMFASGRGPALQTDATFLRSHCNGSQFAGGKANERSGDILREIAESEGQSTKGKVYLGQLAAYPGDPKAWVDGRGDVARVCAERSWNCSGGVTVKNTPDPRPPGRKRKKLQIPV